MNKNNNLSETTYSNNNRTYFIHIKKSDITDIEDMTMIKNLLEDQINDSVNISDFKFINKSDLINKSHKEIGKYLKSNKLSICAYCKEDIIPGTTFKQLNCKHRFHVNCIDSKLKKDIYKKCVCCNSEQISASI
jgi:hypothetical protein